MPTREINGKTWLVGVPVERLREVMSQIPDGYTVAPGQNGSGFFLIFDHHAAFVGRISPYDGSLAWLEQEEPDIPDWAFACPHGGETAQ